MLEQRGSPPGAVRCAVGAVVANVDKPYFVAHVQEASGELDRHDTITVSSDDWKGPGELKAGLLVDVFDVRRFIRGWRGTSACAVTPETEGSHE